MMQQEVYNIAIRIGLSDRFEDMLRCMNIVPNYTRTSIFRRFYIQQLTKEDILVLKLAFGGQYAISVIRNWT